MLNNIVDNIEQCGQHSIVQGCFINPEQVVRFFAVQQAVFAGTSGEVNHSCYARVTLTNVPFFDPSPKFAIRSKAVHSWRVTPRVNQRGSLKYGYL